MEKAVDEMNWKIHHDRVLLRDQVEGPRVGDFIRMKDGSLRRFAHDWDESGLQITSAGSLGSFYLGNGYLDHSGGLDPIVPLAHIQEVSGTREGSCWFFDHDHHRKDGGIDATVPCRLYKEVAI